MFRRMHVIALAMVLAATLVGGLLVTQEDARASVCCSSCLTCADACDQAYLACSDACPDDGCIIGCERAWARCYIPCGCQGCSTCC
jgi:hypothetical protein